MASTLFLALRPRRPSLSHKGFFCGMISLLDDGSTHTQQVQVAFLPMKICAALPQFPCYIVVVKEKFVTHYICYL